MFRNTTRWLIICLVVRRDHSQEEVLPSKFRLAPKIQFQILDSTHSFKN